MNDEDADMASMVTTFNTAVTETASENFGKHRKKKKPWVTADILDLWENWEKKDSNLKDLRNTGKWTTTPRGAEKKAKENWIGEQCGEIEETLRKNNSKRAYQLVKDLTKKWKREAKAIQDRSGKCLTEEQKIMPMNRKLLWAVQSQD